MKRFSKLRACLPLQEEQETRVVAVLPFKGPSKKTSSDGGGLLLDTGEQRLKLQTGLGRNQSRVWPSAFVCTSIRTTADRPDIVLKEVMEAKRDVQLVVRDTGLLGAELYCLRCLMHNAR